MRTSIEVNDQQLRAKIRSLIDQIDDMTPAMKKIGVFVNTEIQENFLTGGRPKKWQELSEFTKNRRLRRSRGLKKKRASSFGSQAMPLLDTGRLMLSIHRLEVTDHAVIVGTNVKYAQIQNEGGHVPARTIHNVRVKRHYRRPEGKRNHWVKEFRRTQVFAAHDIPARQFMIVPEAYPTIIRILEDHINVKDKGNLPGGQAGYH